MEELFENKILDELYEIRGEEFIGSYTKKYGKPEKVKKAEKAEEQLVQFMKKFIKDESNMKKLYEKINIFESYALDEMSFWHKPYYKFGFIDGLNLKREIQEEKNIANDQNKSIIYQNINEISDFFEEQKYKNLKQNNDYMKIVKEIEEIKKRFSKVRSFFENEEITEFSKEEMKAILEIIKLHNDIEGMELEEMFKLGIKEGRNL